MTRSHKCDGHNAASKLVQMPNAEPILNSYRCSGGQESILELREVLNPDILHGNLRDPTFLDVVFVSIDFEAIWCPKCPVRIYKIGVSTLDTRDLCKSGCRPSWKTSYRHDTCALERGLLSPGPGKASCLASLNLFLTMRYRTPS